MKIIDNFSGNSFSILWALRLDWTLSTILEACWKQDCKRHICVESCGGRPFLLAISRVSRTKGSTWLLQSKYPNFTWARDVLICTTQKEHSNLLKCMMGGTELEGGQGRMGIEEILPLESLQLLRELGTSNRHHLSGGWILQRQL
jgi:hypothetical protein